jgi:hypothetical protein
MSSYRSRLGENNNPTPKGTPKPNSNQYFKKRKPSPVRSIPLEMSMNTKRIVSELNKGIPKSKKRKG